MAFEGGIPLLCTICGDQPAGIGPYIQPNPTPRFSSPHPHTKYHDSPLPRVQVQMPGTTTFGEKQHVER